MPPQNQDRQVNIRGEILIEGPARLIGSFTGTIAEGRVVTSGDVSIGEQADVHTSIEPDRVSVEPGEASLTYVPAPATTDPAPPREAAEAPTQQAEYQPPRQQVQPAPSQAQEAPQAQHEPEPPQVAFPKNQPQVPEGRRPRQHAETEDNAARQARARLAAYSRQSATGTDDPSGWAAS